MSLAMDNLSIWVSEVGIPCGSAFGFWLEFAKFVSYMV